MPDLSRQKALADRQLTKWCYRGTVTVRSTALDALVPEQTANVLVYLKERASTPDDPVKIPAVMSATSFPIQGGELVVNGATYDIVEVNQKGVGLDHIVQFVVLHER